MRWLLLYKGAVVMPTILTKPQREKRMRANPFIVIGKGREAV